MESGENPEQSRCGIRRIGFPMPISVPTEVKAGVRRRGGPGPRRHSREPEYFVRLTRPGAASPKAEPEKPFRGRKATGADVEPAAARRPARLCSLHGTNQNQKR